MQVVRSRDSSANETCQNPLFASNLLKCVALDKRESMTSMAGVGYGWGWVWLSQHVVV